MNALILAAGESERFGGRCKALLEFDGEPLIARTVRQAQTWSDVTVVTHRQDLADCAAISGVSSFNPSGRRVLLDSFLSSFTRWSTSERTIVLLGDVRYTDEAMRRIMNAQEPFAFFTDGMEIYAFTFAAKARDEVCRAAFEGFLRATDGSSFCNDGKLWQLLYTLHGHDPRADINRHFVIPASAIGKSVHFIRDETCDFDTQEDYDAFLAGKPDRANTAPGRGMVMVEPLTVRTALEIHALGLGVIHVGAHTGEEIGLYSLLGMDCLLVEPNPELAARLKALGHSVLECAVWPTRGKVKFHVAEQTRLSSLLKSEFASREIEVQSAPLRDVQAYAGSYIGDASVLVVDAQGASLPILQSGDLSNFKLIVVEAGEHVRYEGEASKAEIISYIASQGFEIIGEETHGAGENAVTDLICLRT